MSLRGGVLVIFGTRPEAIKLAPVVRALRARGVPTDVLCTGQHTTLLSGVPAELAGAPALGFASEDSVPRFLTTAGAVLRDEIEARRPTAVVVQGDTMSAYAATAAAVACDVPVGHVEAGVRSGSLSEPWPEEELRRRIDELATWRFAPTQVTMDNLAAEGLDGMLVGNPVVDALQQEGATARDELLHDTLAAPYVLITLHRRELRLRADVRDILQAVADGATRFPAVEFAWPLHPAMAGAISALTVPTNLHRIEPLAYTDLLATLAGARGVLTDSGGLVEEAATLGVPTAILRNVNDRPEAVAAGVARLCFPTPVGVKRALRMLVDKELPRRPTDAFGDGHAGERIASHLAVVLGVR